MTAYKLTSLYFFNDLLGLINLFSLELFLLHPSFVPCFLFFHTKSQSQCADRYTANQMFKNKN